MNEFGNNLTNTSDGYIEYLEKKRKEKIESFRKNSLIDLHAHTNFSDGELSPNELIKLAMKNNIGTLSITDHDTIEGLKNIKYGHDETDYVKIINGIELSAKTDNGRMHILGYGIDINNKSLNKKTKELKEISLYSVLAIITQLKKDYNISFSYDEIRDLINYNGTLGRPYIAKLLIKNGYVNSVQEAFDKYLIDASRKTKVHNKGIPYLECIQLILNSGGIPVLAHPKTLKLNDKELLYLIKDMINVGLKGIEVYHSTHTKEETLKFLKIAKEFNLLISGGSDYHGLIIKPNIELGTGKDNNLKIKSLSLLNELKKQ